MTINDFHKSMSFGLLNKWEATFNQAMFGEVSCVITCEGELSDHLLSKMRDLRNCLEFSWGDIVDVLYGHYKNCELTAPHAWLSQCNVPTHLTIDGIVKHVSDPTLMIHNKLGTAKIAFGIDWDPEHGAYLTINDGSIWLFNECKFSLNNGVLIWEED